MKFYYAPGSISLVVHIALEMRGVNYQAIAIDFSNKQQRSAAFLTINPLGRVPALVTADGVITEALAILNYLQNSGETSVDPQSMYAEKTPFSIAKIDSFNAFMASTVHVAHAHLWRAERWADAEVAKAAMADKVAHNMIEYFSQIEHHWFVGPWLHGEQFTSSDLYLFVISRWLKGDGVDMQQFEKVANHNHRMLQIKAVAELVDKYYS
ncbi:MAG: glutathione S-transferase family protein [Oceanospirillaceae bacterium]|nr:glutathione S-transferase family protein [Oceanospirillaceae bacterium]